MGINASGESTATTIKTSIINRNILIPRLRRTVADRKRLLTKVIEGLGQHGMVRRMVVVMRTTMV